MQEMEVGAKRNSRCLANQEGGGPGVQRGGTHRRPPHGAALLEESAHSQSSRSSLLFTSLACGQFVSGGTGECMAVLPL